MKFSSQLANVQLWFKRYSSFSDFNQRDQFNYLVAIIFASTLVQLLTPIRMGDTDMWYHLSDGKYFWENLKVADSYFYSYYPQESTWFNHFWGFQAIIYKIFSYFDYQGLVIFRSLLVGMIIVAMGLVLFRNSAPEVFWPKFIIFFLATIIILERGYQLRPHLFSYLMIPLFIYFLEHQKKHVFILPVLGIIWLNTHAIEWVIAALICGAYFIEEILKNKDERNIGYILAILACPVAFILTPNTIELIKAPFNIPENFGNYISELKSLPLSMFYSINFSLEKISFTAAFTILFLTTLVYSLIQIKNKSLRLSHAILGIGSLYLLSKGQRFIWEWVLLNLPLLNHARNNLNIYSNIRKFFPKLIVFIFAFFPFYQLSQMLDLDQKYPFNPKHLPVSTVQFLKAINAEGNLLATPNKAGFLQQQLWPNIKIHSDMKSNDKMFLELSTALLYPDAMQHFIEKYEIDFFLQEDASSKTRDKFISYGFEIIYFEPNGTLYAHRERQKHLINKHKIQFDLFEDIEKIDTDLYISELNRLKSISPNKQILIAAINKLFKEKKYKEALRYAENLYQNHPYDPNSSYWLGNLYENLSLCNKALPYFEEALKLSDKDFQVKVMKHIGTCNYILQNFEAAYEAFNKSLNIFIIKEAHEDMFQYAFSSIIVGNFYKAEILLETIINTAPDEKDDVRKAAIKLKKDLDNGKFDAPGFFNWATDQIMGIFQS